MNENKAAVDAAIIQTVVPRLYNVIDDLIDFIGDKNIPKPLLVEAKKLLPRQYRNSFERPKP